MNALLDSSPQRPLSQTSDGHASYDQAWHLFTQAMERAFGSAPYKSWLSLLSFVRFDADIHTLILSVPGRFAKDWIASNYLRELIQLSQGFFQGTARIELMIDDRSNPSFSPNIAPANSQSVVSSEPVHAPQGVSPMASVPPMGYAPSTHRASYGSDEGGSFESLQYDMIGAQLDSRFTFDEFVVGKPNELAYAAARRVAESPEVKFNPLFLYGGVGLGKTHLMHAIALHIQKHQPGRRVLYLSAEKFMYQFVRALRFKDTMAFKELFRNVDVLMIDDVQFISGKDTTQEEFFHTFNALVDRNHQVIVSADKSPSDLEGMEERLKSRLGWGLVADIHPTTYELRLGILQAKADTLSVPIPKNVIEFLASKVSTNVRELEGALNRIAAHATLVNQEISLASTQEALRDLIKSSDKRVTVDDIQKRVAEYYGIKLSEMQSSKRAHTIARPRQIAMYLSKMLTTRSLPDIGRRFGGRDHTTVIHAVKKIEQLIESDSELADDVGLLRKNLTF